ncbi:hypothetical protein HAX54_039265 [Datura stramonium]|uniref:Uncharacterized protein n=1 Tax=Datura stramonium TaxID=4076 RepID=A0ABS8VP28_DATST|nr:hypothetical protein [Datura stramonium]
MAPKPSKGKGVASSSNESKRSKGASEEKHDDVSHSKQPLRRYGLRWVTQQEDKKWFKEHKESKYSHDLLIEKAWHLYFRIWKRFCLVYALKNGVLVNVGLIIKNVLRRARAKKGLRFGFKGLLTQYQCGHQIEEEEMDYRPRYYPRGIDVTNDKELEGVHGTVLSFNVRNARIDNMLSHLVGLGFEEPLDDDVAIEDEMARVDSDIESSDAEKEDSELRKAALVPIDEED